MQEALAGLHDQLLGLAVTVSAVRSHCLGNDFVPGRYGDLSTLRASKEMFRAIFMVTHDQCNTVICMQVTLDVQH